MPVAIIMGTEDGMHRGAELLHQRLPQSHFVSIQEAPHDSMNARPEAFNQGFLEYLENLEQGKVINEIKVDAHSRSSVPSIFAVGDVTDRIQLTPIAIREGHAFAGETAAFH